MSKDYIVPGDVDAEALIVMRKYLQDIVIPAAPYPALTETRADRQTFQVLKTWKV